MNFAAPRSSAAICREREKRTWYEEIGDGCLLLRLHQMH